jgi:Membrane bound O-acyl transferase family
MLRVACAGCTVLAVFRNLDLYRERTLDAGQRALHAIALFDSRRLVRVSPHFATGRWLRAAAFGALTALFAWLLLSSRVASAGPHSALRWACGVAWAYTSIETATAFARAVAGLFGAELPKLHDDPIRSRTLREFWGQRWNLSVRDMLHEHCFRPLVSRFGVSTALLGTFVASAVLHFWLALAALGLASAASMAGYFLVQGALALLERRLAVRDWREAVQRAWTAICLLVPLPLLLEPLLQVAFA